MDIKALKNKWLGVGAEVEETEYAQCGYDYDIKLGTGKVHAFAELMLAEGFYLVSVTAVHAKPAIEVVYHFAIVGGERCRVMARVAVQEDGSVPTICDVYNGANWHEREVRDFYGVVFDGHPNLQPLILAEEDADMKPLLKDEKKLKDIGELRRKAPEAEGDEAAPAEKKVPAAAEQKAAKPQASN
jgi:NADH-quinone oxidoreductase subunit C